MTNKFRPAVKSTIKPAVKSVIAQEPKKPIPPKKFKSAPTKKPIPPKKPRHEKINPKQILLNHKLQSELREKHIRVFDDANSSHLNIDDKYLTLPYNISDTPIHILGEHMNALTQHKIYLRNVYAEVCCLEVECKWEYNQAKAFVLKDSMYGKMSVTEKELIIGVDPLVMPKYRRYVEIKAKINVLEQSIANVTDAIFMVSREISRRGADFTQERRDMNVGGCK